MNTEHDWSLWWDNEGSGMRPLNGQDHELHVRDMTRIAWLNGAFGAADEIDRLRRKLLGEENAFDILRIENERLLKGGCARDQDTTQFCAEAMTLQQQRDEAIILANAVIRESSRLITAKIPCGSCSGYWNSVDEFRRFEEKNR